MIEFFNKTLDFSDLENLNKTDNYNQLLEILMKIIIKFK